jgi:hypothetical protein
VTVESILTEEAVPLKGSGGPKGKLQKIFEETATLPRRQQEKIAEFVAASVNQYKQEQARCPNQLVHQRAIAAISREQ